jgi:hypothetical protein
LNLHAGWFQTFNDGVLITEEFYSAKISGWHNNALAGQLSPELEHQRPWNSWITRSFWMNQFQI